MLLNNLIQSIITLLGDNMTFYRLFKEWPITTWFGQAMFLSCETLVNGWFWFF